MANYERERRHRGEWWERPETERERQSYDWERRNREHDWDYDRERQGYGQDFQGYGRESQDYGRESQGYGWDRPAYDHDRQGRDWERPFSGREYQGYSQQQGRDWERQGYRGSDFRLGRNFGQQDYEGGRQGYGVGQKNRGWEQEGYRGGRQGYSFDERSSGQRFGFDQNRGIDRQSYEGWYPDLDYGQQGRSWEHQGYRSRQQNPGFSQQNFNEESSSGRRYAGRGPKGYQRSDERIKEEVCERLTQHPAIDASEIEVDVKNGEVTLKGTVDNRSEKHLAENLVESVSGAKDIHNQLRLSQGQHNGQQSNQQGKSTMQSSQAGQKGQFGSSQNA